LDSPLAKLFGKPAILGLPPRESARRGQRGEVEEGKASREVEAIKGELKEVRESQLRMEEMLAKVLAGVAK
jgi:hypothetical protein